MKHPVKRWLLGVLLTTPQLAFAHSPIKGINNFYNGLLHPVLVPSHLLLIAAGLFVGQHATPVIRQALGVCVLAALLGLLASNHLLLAALEAFLLCAAATLGILVAAHFNVPSLVCGAIAGVVGFAVGLDSVEETLTATPKLMAMTGTFVGICLLFLYVVGLANYCKQRDWQIIGTRIVGSWIAASALLVLALLVAAKP